MEDFSHFNDQGRAHMVDVAAKTPSRREARAYGRVLVNRETFALIRSGGLKKGDVLTVAQVAGIMGAKNAASLVPMCHPLALTGVNLEFRMDRETPAVEIYASVGCTGQTGVEMEALAAVSAAALTIYDMCKAAQRDMVIDRICLLEKRGGKSGDFVREETP